FGAAKALINLAKAFYVVSMAEFPADDGIGQSAQNVSVFVSVQHDEFPILRGLGHSEFHLVGTELDFSAWGKPDITIIRCHGPRMIRIGLAWNQFRRQVGSIQSGEYIAAPDKRRNESSIVRIVLVPGVIDIVDIRG